MGCRNATNILLVLIIIFICLIFNSLIFSFKQEKYNIKKFEYINNELLSYTFSFSEPNFNEKTLHDKTYSTIDISGCVAIGKKEGEPVLPVKYVKLLLPPGQKIVDVNVDGTSVEIVKAKTKLANKPVVPYQTPAPIGKKFSTKFEFNESLYHSLNVYPLILEEDYQTSCCRGYTILSLTLNPVQYIPGASRILYFPEITVDIELEKDGNINNFFRNNQDDENWVKTLVANPEIIEYYKGGSYSFGAMPTYDYSGGLCDSSDNYDYVIVTTTENGLDDWATSPSLPYNWSSLMGKHELEDGLSCTLVTIQEINACSDYWNASSLFNDTTAHIREFCRDAYQDWGTEYIFIGGDDELIPAREMDYAYESDVDSDIYWSNLDNTFNDDEDSEWGEEGDSGFDLYAEMYIGRITCDEPQDVSNWMKKSFYYVDSKTVDYLENAAFYGGDSGWDCEGDDFIDFSAIKGTEGWLGPNPNSDGPYPSWLGFQYGFETWNDVNPTKQYNLSVKWTAEPPNSGWLGGSESAAINGLKNAINNDQCTLISGVAHADESMSLDVSSANWESNYHNTKPFFIYDYGCHCGDMDAADDGVLHSMLFHSDTELAFACVYNTCYGWGNLQTTNTSSSLLQKCFWDYFFDTTNNSVSPANWQLGKAMAFSKDTIAPTIDWDTYLGTWRAVIQGCLLFGDPAQKLKLGNEDPINLSNENPANETVGSYFGSLPLGINVSDPEGNLMNITFRTNASGIWQDIGTNNSQLDGRFYQSYVFSNYNTTYWWSVNVTDIYGSSGWTNETYHFTTRQRYLPTGPVSFSAIAYNRSQINLIWVKGTNADKTYIEWNNVESWSKGDGNFIDNSSTNTSFCHNGLNFGITYYYQAWSWNETDRCWSLTNSSDNATTPINTVPVLTEENPNNTTVNQQRKPICNITVTDVDLDSIDVCFYENTTGIWVLQQGNASVSSGSNVIWNNYTNASNYNTKYWWSVNVTDGHCDINKTYWFITMEEPWEYNCPTSSNENPENKSSNIEIDVGDWTVNINDIDGNTTSGTIVCSNGDNTSWTDQTNGTRTLNFSGNLNYNTNYTIWLNFTDGNCNVNETYWFTIKANSDSGNNGPDGSSSTNPTFVSLTAEAGGPYTGVINTTVQFSGTASNGTTPYTYNWDFGDSNTGSGETPTHIYTTAGSYTAKLTVTDSASATDTDTATVTINPASLDDTTPPVITNIQHSPTTVTNQDIVTISATITDDTSVSSVNLNYNDGIEKTKPMTFTNGNTYSTTIGPFPAGTTVTYYITATDTSANTEQSSVYSFTVKEITVINIGNIIGYETHNVNSTEIDLSLTSNTDLPNVQIKIINLELNKPEDIPDIPEPYEHIYAYLELDLTSNNMTIDDSTIQSLKINFKIVLTWFTENNKNIDKNNVKLLRYHEGVWEELPTTYLNKDNTYAYYQAISTGTSTYAIVGSETTEHGAKPKEGLPWLIIIGAIITGIVLFIALLFKIGYLYFEPIDKNKGL